jgi:hypothetical protein
LSIHRTDLERKVEQLIGKQIPDDVTQRKVKHLLVEAGYPALTRSGITIREFEAIVDAELLKKETK